MGIDTLGSDSCLGCLASGRLGPQLGARA